jgi:hypothetical protein
MFYAQWRPGGSGQKLCGIWIYSRSICNFLREERCHLFVGVKTSKVERWFGYFGNVFESSDVVLSYARSFIFEFTLLESQGISDSAHLRERRSDGLIAILILAVTYRELRFITNYRLLLGKPDSLAHGSLWTLFHQLALGLFYLILSNTWCNKVLRTHFFIFYSGIRYHSKSTLPSWWSYIIFCAYCTECLCRGKTDLGNWLNMRLDDVLFTN